MIDMPTLKFLCEYQRQVEVGLMLNPKKIDAISHCALGLCAEAGEVADLIKKSQYERPCMYTREDMKLELGDVVWYATALAGRHGYILADILDANIRKLMERHPTAKYDASALYG